MSPREDWLQKSVRLTTPEKIDAVPRLESTETYDIISIVYLMALWKNFKIPPMVPIRELPMDKYLLFRNYSPVYYIFFAMIV